MHASVLAWGIDMVDTVKPTGKRVLEVGSLDENGSLRPYVEAHDPSSYIGVDMRIGPRVDMVLDATELIPQFGTRSFDLVICTEMLEHAERWQVALHHVKQQVARGGWLLLTTRSPGFPRHGYPDDHWRFTRSMMEVALSDMTAASVQKDPGDNAPGVLCMAGGPARSMDLADDPVLMVAAIPAPTTV